MIQMNRIFGASLLALLPSLALAELPKFDVNTHCDNVANAIGESSEMIRSGCFEQEQTSYNNLKKVWETLPKSMQSHCTAVAKSMAPGSYMILDGCVTQELESKAGNSNFQFKY